MRCGGCEERCRPKKLLFPTDCLHHRTILPNNPALISLQVLPADGCYRELPLSTLTLALLLKWVREPESHDLVGYPLINVYLYVLTGLRIGCYMPKGSYAGLSLRMRSVFFPL